MVPPNCYWHYQKCWKLLDYLSSHSLPFPSLHSEPFSHPKQLHHCTTPDLSTTVSHQSKFEYHWGHPHPIHVQIYSEHPTHSADEGGQEKESRSCKRWRQHRWRWGRRGRGRSGCTKGWKDWDFQSTMKIRFCWTNLQRKHNFIL